MKYINSITFFIVISVIMFSSCNKEEEEIDQLTPYDNAQGLWYYTSECDEEIIDEFTGFLPSSFTVEGEGEGELSINFLDTIILEALIDQNGIVLIPQQTLLEIDTLGFSIPINISGEGLINSEDIGSLNLVYSVNLFPIIEEEINCEVELSREEIFDEDLYDMDI